MSRSFLARLPKLSPYPFCVCPSRAFCQLSRRPPTSVQYQRQPRTKPVQQSSYTTYAIVIAVAFGATIFLDYLTQSSTPINSAVAVNDEPVESLVYYDPDTRTPFFANMPVPPGSLGTLTPEEEQKLREFWALVLKTFAVNDPTTSTDASESARPITPGQPIHPATGDSSTRKERLSIFHRRKKDSVAGLDGSSSPGSPSTRSDPEDKYNQTKELQDILASQSPETLRATYWQMVKKDHPDALLLRFLRARKWDINRALAMMISTMNWRGTEMHVDDDIMLHGELGAAQDEKSSDAWTKREGKDFLAQLRMGKSFIHGIDADGRPICFVRARLHRGGEQTERALERYTVFLIETARLTLVQPVETATLVFDMTSFSMANMDYTPVKFMIKVFEANYPESLGLVLIHKAPWIFQGIWKIIRGWLDPVVANKVHFTGDVKELSEYIPKSQIIKELGGDEDWVYKYVEPVEGENDTMKNVETRQKLEEERKGDVEEFEHKTFEWLKGEDRKAERDQIAQRLRENYWKLDPYVRARTLYDRTGMIGKDGKVEYYPTQTLKTENMPNGQTESGPDDVD